MLSVKASIVQTFDWRRLSRSLSHSVIYSANFNCLHFKRNNKRHILITTGKLWVLFTFPVTREVQPLMFLSLFCVLYMRLHFSGLK